MRSEPVYILLVVILAVGFVSTQNEDELHIPMEPDNQFPPDQAESDGIADGSGDGVVDNPEEESTTESLPKANVNIQLSTLLHEDEQVEPESNSTDLPCPKPCICHTEGDAEDFVVDCSGYGLTELPSPIDPRTTTLKLHNNKLTEIPKAVSDLKKLKVLNANDNSIMELALGSVSELPELVTLKLAKNLLLEYPKDLKNSLSLTKLEELDIGGNDIRTIISPEILSNFESLHKITLPERTSTIALDLCLSLKSLVTICTESCEAKTFDCPNAPQGIEEDLLEATLPGMIPYESNLEDTDSDPALNSDTLNNEQPPVASPPLKGSEESPVKVSEEPPVKVSEEPPVKVSEEPPVKVSEEPPVKGSEEPPVKSSEEPPVKASEVIPAISAPEKSNEESTIDSRKPSAREFSLQNAVDEAPHMAVPNVQIVNPVEVPTGPPDVKIGATVDVKKSGGVDKSVIGIIVAGMIVIVAVITIKKNWSSIKKRFSSTPRPNERAEGNANGTTPEEVPLQDKSPV